METLNKVSGVLALVAVVIAIGYGWYNAASISQVASHVASFGAVGTRFPNGLVAGSGSITTAGDFIADTNTLVVDSTNNRVGFGTTTPGGNLSIGKTGTSTVIFSGVPCFAFPAEGAGNGVIYFWPSTTTSSGRNSSWATSTTACYSTP